MSEKILIYGGSGGVGKSLANKLHSLGYDLHLAGRNEQSLADISNDLGCDYTVGDVLNEEFFVESTSNAGDDLKSIVYAVGTINLKGLSRLTTDDFSTDYAINVIGAANAVKAALNTLRTNKGSVVLFSSVASQVGFPMHGSIGSAKAAINGLTLSLAAELAPNVRVNAIAPSLTDTPLASKVLANDNVKESIANMHPLKRLGTPEDIAGLAAYPISDEASWVTGQVLGLDGGRSNIA